MGFYGTVRRLGQVFGVDVSRYSKLRSDAFLVQQYLLQSVGCRTIFDVGGYKGDVAAQYRRLFPACDIYSFEPFPDSYSMLVRRFAGDVKVHPVNCAVSSITGVSSFYVNENPATNSVLATGQGHAVSSALTKKVIDVPVTSLDDFAVSHKLPAPDILKFDIQGNELNALRGAERMLSGEGPLLIYTEVLFERLYQNCGLFGDLVAFLSRHGYDLYSLYSLQHTPLGRLEFGDALFVSSRLMQEC